MDSRLDRLITLLEDGIDDESKGIAATKIGEVVKLHHSASELSYVLKRILPLLRNVGQSTRIYASIAVGEISKNIPQFDPRMASTVTIPLPNNHSRKFVGFDPSRILSSSERLMKSDAKRKLESLAANSSRQREGNVKESSSKRRKVGSATSNSIKVEFKKKDEDESDQLVSESFWPFHLITKRLFLDLTSPLWHFRHGAALALKEILNTHCETAGMYAFGNDTQRRIQNLTWLEDCGVRVLTVLTLDRFCDFVADSVIAPVREECAKVLGIIIRGLTSQQNLMDIVKCLEQMMTSNEWEARHSALLGFTHIIQLRKDVFLNNHHIFFQHCLTPLVRGLSDQAEDVVAQAAEGLFPLAEFVTWQDVVFTNDYSFLVRCLWLITKDEDDISTHVSNVVKLLTAFYTFSSQMTDFWRNVFFSSDLINNIPYLWKFLRHSLQSVRLTTIQSLDQLIRLNNLSRWVDVHHQDLVRYLFQNIILERDENIQNLSYQVLELVLRSFSFITIDRKLFGQFITMISLDLNETSTGPENKFRKDLFLIPKSFFKESSNMLFRFTIHENALKMQKWGCLSLSRIIVNRTMRNNGVKEEFISAILLQLAKSKWCVHRRILGMILCFLPSSFLSQQQQQRTNTTIEYFDRQVLDVVKNEIIVKDLNVLYNDINKLFCKIVNSCNEVMKFYRSKNIDFENFIENHAGITVENSIEIVSSPYSDMCHARISQNAQWVQEFEELKSNVESSRVIYITQRSLLHHPTLSVVACGMINHHFLPQNVSSIVRSMIHTLKTENETIQELTARFLGKLTKLRNDLSNKITFIIMDDMMKNQPTIERIKDLTEDSDTDPKKKKKKKKKLPGSTVSGGLSLYSSDDMIEMKPKDITLRGMRLALSFICVELGENLFPVNKLLNIVAVKEIAGSSPQKYRQNKLGISVFLLRELIPKLTKTENHQRLLMSLLPKLISFLSLPDLPIVEEVGHAISVLTKELTVPAMQILHRQMILPLKQPNVSDRFKLGAVFTIHRLVQHLRLDLLPFVVLFILPLLKCMSDPNPSTRAISSSCFGLLIKILPLENASANPPGINEVMTKERLFLDQLLDSKKIPKFQLPPNMIQNVKLRPYQEEGVSWLGFLNRFHLHGILCDDMGLGKTLQTICIMAYDIFEKKKSSRNQSIAPLLLGNSSNSSFVPPPSIIVAPGTLVDHWFEEFRKFCPSLTVHRYTGQRGSRIGIWDVQGRKLRTKMDVLIMSYEVCRNDIEFINYCRYNYIVLDEGHIIKNSKSKISQSVKSIISEHRLVLSGTPVQNSVVELWSLFDFLMPGFLGRTRRAFQGRYGRSISRSRESKSGSKARADGVLALESLHKQVLPFILRRLKEDVLDDLPPKIIQDYYCHMTNLQKETMEYYDRFIDVQGAQTFQKLEFLRKLVIHPTLVMKDVSAQHQVYRKLEATKLTDYKVSPKFIALKQLLIDTGIASMEGEESGEPSGHRSLIFCQYKSTIETLIGALLNKMNVRYLRLDGTVAMKDRQGMVKKFNEDPSYGLLLLTKRIGGYGLNLTGADMVIFIEHDYNFAVDKQAMDRCHRIGQKKVVNVYRLIVKDSIEEEKLGLQRFKQHVADSIINTENTNLDSLGTSNVVDKFG